MQSWFIARASFAVIPLGGVAYDHLIRDDN